MNEKTNYNKILAFLYAHIFDLLFNIPSIVAAYEWVKKTIIKAEFTTLEILLSSLIFANTLIWILIIRNYYGYPSLCRKAPYEYVSRTISYVRNPKDDSLNVARFGVVRSKINGLGIIRDRFLWTGDSDAKLPLPGKNVSKILPDESIGIWTYFSVQFKDVISKGKTEYIKYVWPTIQNCSSSSPFVSTDTEYETKDLCIEVTLGKKYANRELKLEVYRSIESECPISSKTVLLDEDGHYKWEIHKPLRYRYFRARWEWIKE